ncbi:MAG TPA: Gfo/Idh/MocA family oxidoreductase [Bryobacteraceae bacterium]|nr:Gfo/Idh/MocA family oxidoreductase [Bryobacteraceae bacterium]
MPSIAVGIAGLGQFGRNHLRVLQDLPGVEIAAVADTDRSRLDGLSFPAFTDARELIGRCSAAVVATPTLAHADVGCALLQGGVDVLVEKPIAPDLTSADRLIRAAAANGRILQVGHLERFNPGVRALRGAATLPLFFEIHRMSVFTPRSLDVDVVLDLMIHDIDVLLSLTGDEPNEIRAAGIRILSEKVDIANVRLAFANGCVANLTASRVSVEKIRKVRVFQPNEYISLDYARQDAARVTVRNGEAQFESLPVTAAEPLRLQLESFLECVRNRQRPEVSGEDGRKALAVCLEITDTIEAHGATVRRTLAEREATAGGESPS